MPEYSVNIYLPTSVSKCYIGQELGYVEIIVDNQIYSTLNVLADEQINEPTFMDNLHEIIDDFV